MAARHPDKCVSVSVHFADVGVLGKAFYVTLLLGVVHFLINCLVCRFAHPF
jgi:hypothetical protein